MFESLKEYIKIKSGLAQSSQQVRDIERGLSERIDFLAAYMNLTWPAHLSIDPTTLALATRQVNEELGVNDYSTAIHKNDLMFAFHVNRYKYELQEAVASYLRVGASTAQNLNNILEKNGLQPGSLLDFGSGYGRVARFLPHYFPNTKISVSEVKEQAVSFQREAFGLNGIAHSQDADAFPSEKYDAILALSVFTHLPEAAWQKWMERLLQCLNPGGALVFTFLNQTAEASQNILRQLENKAESFIYIERSEDQHFSFVQDSIMDDQVYGSSFVTHDYLRHQLEPQCREIHFLERQLVKGQDALIALK
ncbi:MAG: class I SAM-dependent methyltransferase [Owenweeksia sp.]|nr:class I SAM-dependent methyltransferase [Owenweeksia sp.]